MNKEQIIQRAQQCGFSKTHSGVVNLWLANADDLERFAKLVAEHEREACAKVCETEWSNVAERMYGEECAAAIRTRGQA